MRQLDLEDLTPLHQLDLQRMAVFEHAAAAAASAAWNNLTRQLNDLLASASLWSCLMCIKGTDLLALTKVQAEENFRPAISALFLIGGKFALIHIAGKPVLQTVHILRQHIQGGHVGLLNGLTAGLLGEAGNLRTLGTCWPSYLQSGRGAYPACCWIADSHAHDKVVGIADMLPQLLPGSHMRSMVQAHILELSQQDCHVPHKLTPDVDDLTKCHG